jgi:tetratricopeptide (TPR) repeat protein
LELRQHFCGGARRLRPGRRRGKSLFFQAGSSKLHRAAQPNDMSKRKRLRPTPGNATAAPQPAGLKPFRQGNYTEAIQSWGRPELDNEPAVRAALAEAHFRRALDSRSPQTSRLADLTRAVALRPDDARFAYHLGLARHRAAQVNEALTAYARAAELGLQRRGFAFVRGLAQIEQALAAGGKAGPPLLANLPWLGAAPEEQAALLPIAALAGGQPRVVLSASPAGWWERVQAIGRADLTAALWEGLAWLATGEPAKARARLAFPPGRQLPAGAEGVRAYYSGLAAVAAGDAPAALTEWTAAAKANANGPAGLRHALTHLRRLALHELGAAGRWAEAHQQAQDALTLAPGEPALLQFSLVAANRLAQAAAEAGDWPAAILRWQAMRGILEQHPDLGPLPPVLRNLAIAHERLEQWEPAAAAWAALLKSLPRQPRRSAKASQAAPEATPGGSPVDAQRAWLRRRVLDDYRRADRPDEAIVYYKQASKAAPDDLNLRLELAAALLANDQALAARNEIQRILAKDPHHLGAFLLLAEVHQAREEWYAAEQALRSALAIDPQHAAARRGLAQMMLERGVEAFNSGRYELARTTYAAALEFSPADPQLLVNLAETELVLNQEPAAREHFAAALATGESDAYAKVFEGWLKHDREAEARQVLARAEAASLASPQFYLEAGSACLTLGAPLPGVPGPFGPPPKLVRSTDEWETWGRDLVERGLAGSPQPGEALRFLISTLGVQQPALGVDYARRLAALEPGDPAVWLSLGMLQALNQDSAAAKDTLRKAEKLARQQGQPELVQEIVSMRREIGSPLFGMLGSLLASLGPEALDDFADEEFFK